MRLRLTLYMNLLTYLLKNKSMIYNLFPQEKFKVLTLWQPWATLLIHGVKKIETRPKPTNWTVEKGTYLIHAASKWSKTQADICLQEPFKSELINLCALFRGKPIVYDILNKEIDYFSYKNWNIKLPLGQIIGSIEVTECKQILKYTQDPFRDHPFYWANDKKIKIIGGNEKVFGNYESGRNAWLTQNPRLLETPIPYKGGQGYYQNFKGDTNQLKFI